MNIYISILNVVTFLLLLLSAANSMKCYECNANEDIYCAEMFNPDKIDVEPSSCDHIHEASYCIKTTGLYEGTIGTRRFCSSRHHGNYCEYVRRPGDDRFYRSCVFTCYRDGCNTGSQQTTSLVSIVVLIGSLILFRYI